MKALARVFLHGSSYKNFFSAVLQEFFSFSVTFYSFGMALPIISRISMAESPLKSAGLNHFCSPELFPTAKKIPRLSYIWGTERNALSEVENLKNTYDRTE